MDLDESIADFSTILTSWSADASIGLVDMMIALAESNADAIIGLVDMIAVFADFNADAIIGLAVMIAVFAESNADAMIGLADMMIALAESKGIYDANNEDIFIDMIALFTIKPFDRSQSNFVKNWYKTEKIKQWRSVTQNYLRISRHICLKGVGVIFIYNSGLVVKKVITRCL